MPAPITNTPFVSPIPSGSTIAAAPGVSSGPSFLDLLQQTVERGGAMQTEADLAVMQALSGEDVTQVEVMAAVKKADLALRMMLQVRNKMLDAYNEIQQIRF
ncbi:MAG: flagellar hook-basal body complex protein FliE [Planctomycetota bacterium]|nr:flagellar hook-basal body complex protein FliE [Planctomycetaceae bacterium]MDQ3330532.1 flagellar hook-basal body complex protein FliE [Planctomycetota bacterium]